MPAVPTAIGALFADLDAAERGFVLGTLVVGTSEAADGAAALEAPARERCAEAARAIMALPRPERVRVMGLLAREALAPVPAGIANVHVDTLRGVLDAESSETIRLVTTDGPDALRAAGAAALAARTDPQDEEIDQETDQETAPPMAAADVVAELQRAVLASIVAVPPAPTGVQPKRWGRHLATLEAAAFSTELMNAGADLLGASLRGADERTLKRAAAHVGAPWGERIAKGANDSPLTSRARAQALVSATAPAENPRQTLERLGARALGDRLGREDPDMALAVAQRLPSELAHELLAASSFATLINT